MRDHEQGAARVRQIALEILDGIGVQVVGRLVHYEELGFGCEHLRQRNALDLAPRQVAHLLLPVQPEVREDARHAQPVLEQMVLVKAFGESLGRVHDLLPHSLLRVEVVLLLEECYAYLLEEHDASAGVGLVLAGEDAHQ